LPHPLGRGHAPRSSEPLDLAKFVVLDEDLEALGHAEQSD
jgi:hypothetical protein